MGDGAIAQLYQEGDLTANEATDVLYDLVNEGTNLHPKVYARVQKNLRELGTAPG